MINYFEKYHSVDKELLVLKQRYRQFVATFALALILIGVIAFAVGMCVGKLAL